MKKTETNTRARKSTKAKQQKASGTLRPGDPCPGCGLELSKGGPTAAAFCEPCGKRFEPKPVKPKRWGKREDAHLAAVEKWLDAEWRADSEIGNMLERGNYAEAARIFGPSSVAWEKGRAILRAELRARKMRAEGSTGTERRDAEVIDWPDMLTIKEAAQYCPCDERTIRNRLAALNPDGTPLLAGVIGKGRLRRIPRVSLKPFRK